MSAKTEIEWTDATWPIVQGCDYDSPGCTHCYAVNVIWRLAHNPLAKIADPLQGLVAKNAAGHLHWTGKVALREDRLAWPMRWREPRRIFVPSHGDIFHEDVPDKFLDKIFGVMALCHRHTFQVLTKRAERMRAYLAAIAEDYDEYSLFRWADAAGRLCQDGDAAFSSIMNAGWPLPNVWLGVSVEDQQRADARIPHLLATPANKRFLSCEPLLGPLDLRGYLVGHEENGVDLTREPGSKVGACVGWTPPLDWVIAGGESGQRARPMVLGWAYGLLQQCKGADVAFFMKQMGSNAISPGAAGADPDGVYRYRWRDRAGGDPAEWMEEFRVREFPA